MTTVRGVWGLGFASVAAATLLSGCGGGEYDISEVSGGSDWRTPIVLVDGGDPVTGKVTVKDANGLVLKETEVVDGLTNGWRREWFADGKPKSEQKLMVDGEGQAMRLKSIGPSRYWCENGTLRQENLFDEDGVAEGEIRSWSCTGKLLASQEQPYGAVKRWSELENGETVLTNEFATGKDGQEGVHKQYHLTGKPSLEENYKAGKKNGDSKRWDENGELVEAGMYADGKKVGLWKTGNMGYRQQTDYDAANFVARDYVQPFMAAAGIQTSGGGMYRNPIRQFQVDPEKIRYYVAEGLVDLEKKLPLDGYSASSDFQSSIWTYPYVSASQGALPLLVELGADPKAVDSDQRSRLHHCMYSLSDANTCSSAEVSRLLALGLGADQADVWGNTPLHELILTPVGWGRPIAKEEYAAIAKALLDAGANPDAQNKGGLSPLMAAASAKKFDLATMFLERSKDPKGVTKDGYNLVHLTFLDPTMSQFNLSITPEVQQFVQTAVNKGVDAQQPIGEMGTLKQIAEKNGAIDMARFFSGLQPKAS